ncbi:MAG: hypothetical protein ACQERT_05310 [Thermodesulfobacteriota bacterium]
MLKIDGLEISLNDHIQKDEVLDLYRTIGWPAAEKPDKLLPALRNSHSLITARLINEGKKLFTFCTLHSAAREINSRLLHARVPP